MKTLPSLLMLTLIGACSAIMAQPVHAETPWRTPPLLEQYRVESFKPYRTPQRPTDGYEMKLPYQFGSWELIDAKLRDKDDKRTNMALLGSKPTMLFVLGSYLSGSVGSKNSKPTDAEKKRQDRLLELFHDLEKHAGANHEKYDVYIVFSTLADRDREAIRELFDDAKPEYLLLAELSYNNTKRDNNFDNYWSNLIAKPESGMVADKDDAPYPLGSWVWIPTPGTAEAWGVWGFESELTRLDDWARASETPAALKVEDSDCREIAALMAQWRLGDAEKKLEKLEKKGGPADAANIEALRDYEAYLEKSYRALFSAPQKEAGYLVEYADALQKLGEELFGKGSTRGGEILDEVKAFRKTDEYEHIEMAKKAFDKLSDRIYSDLNGNVHGQDYDEHHARIMAKHKTGIDKFNKEYGDTPYAETTRKWGEEAAGK
ncbi:MAG: hypothetical protein KDB68_06460 [Planctomycetes bacterium]|nr:hypothetical protein [Planctomycetota bacterium]